MVGDTKFWWAIWNFVHATINIYSKEIWKEAIQKNKNKQNRKLKVNNLDTFFDII